MVDATLDLEVLEEQYSICRLPAGDPLPEWVVPGALTSVTWAQDETSVVCRAESVPGGVEADGPWQALKIVGQFDFDLTGILLSVARPLADAGIGIFAMSTYDTDYVLVKRASLDAAVEALSAYGHRVTGR